MFNVLQKSACMQSGPLSAELILWITQQVMYNSMALKSGGPCTFGPP